jgi:hypothetical protein
VRGRVVEDDVGEAQPSHEELAVPAGPRPVAVPAGERGPQDLELPTLLEDRTELGEPASSDRRGGCTPDRRSH